MRRLISAAAGAALLFASTTSVQATSRTGGSVSFPKGSDVQLVEKYLDYVDKYAKKHCPAGTEKTIKALYKDYRSAGRYLPYTASGDLDKETIKQGLPLLKAKAEWIRETKAQLKKLKTYPKAAAAKPIEKSIDDLLNLKKSAAKPGASVSPLAKKSKEKLKELEKSFDAWAAENFFLLSFGYPVDHLGHRQAFEKALEAGDHSLKNKIYFKRRIVEDGALRRGGRLSDVYERSTFDTLKTRLSENQEQFLANDIRADLEWLTARVASMLRLGKDQMLERFDTWEENTTKDIEFYEALVGIDDDRLPSSVAHQHTAANKKLATYIRKKHAEAYASLAEEPQWIRALFAFDQILLNEVGRATGSNYRERRDVAQVIINRHSHPFYSKLSPSEPLKEALDKLEAFKGKKADQYPWLNVLFKEGQFSFTHYFIPAVEYSICPDFFKVAKLTRRKNAFLAIDRLKNPENDFQALRYFSRFSMTGKIDMASMWDKYKALPEQPGKEVKNPKRVLQAIKKNDFRYFYEFKGADGKTYSVIEVGRDTYSVQDLYKSPQVFGYRDPDKFRFFAARE